MTSIWHDTTVGAMQSVVIKLLDTMNNMNVRSQRKMRDSGVAWIGEVPEGWKLCRIASLYELRNTKCSNREFAPLSVTMKGVMPQLEQVAKTNNGDDRKLVCAGDFVINSRSDRRGACGISQLDGSVSLINIVMKPRGAMDAAYYSWVFRSNGFADEFYAWGHGIVDDLWTTRWSDMKNILVMVPPLPEQQAIADYLDRECGKIDELRAKIEAQIADLATYKKSVITEAVTGKCKIENGEWKMRPRTELRDSGVEWIGEVPAGWKVVPFKRQIFVRSNLVSPSLYPDLPQISPECIEKDSGRLVKEWSVQESGVESGNHLFYKGQIVYSKIRPALNKLVIAPYDGLCSADMYPIESDMNISFVSYLMRSGIFVSQVELVTRDRIKMPKINQEELGLVMIVCPSLPEQREIADYLDKKCGSIDAAVAKCRAQLEDLATYKKSLIFECVTGKKEIA